MYPRIATHATSLGAKRPVHTIEKKSERLVQSPVEKSPLKRARFVCIEAPIIPRMYVRCRCLDARSEFENWENPEIACTHPFRSMSMIARTLHAPWARLTLACWRNGKRGKPLA